MPHGSPVTSSQEFYMGDFYRKEVLKCLAVDGISLGSADLVRFIQGIQTSIREYQRNKSQLTFRAIHDELAEVYHLANDADPDAVSPALLRVRLDELSSPALEQIEKHAARVIPLMFPGESVELGFLEWAKTAEGGMLVRAVAALSADGAQIVSGRSRGSGKRARDRVSPLILGEVRGASDGKRMSGRPKGKSEQRLVMNLAINWSLNTGNMPKPGRTDRTGFGGLVHRVFQWAVEGADENDEATYALRHYWAEVRRLSPATINGSPEAPG